MTSATNYKYKIIAKVENGLGVLARMTLLLRKFNVNIQSLDVDPLDNEKQFYNIHLVIDSKKDDQSIRTVMKKLEGLIPVIKVNYESIS